MSAWYVLSALGFYPVNPASGVYVIGSPLVDKATIHLDPQYHKGRSSPSSPKTIRRRTSIFSRPRSTASRSRGRGSRTTSSWPAANWFSRWDRSRIWSGPHGRKTARGRCAALSIAIKHVSHIQERGRLAPPRKSGRDARAPGDLLSYGSLDNADPITPLSGHRPKVGRERAGVRAATITWRTDRPVLP